MPASYHSSLVEGQWFFNNLLEPILAVFKSLTLLPVGFEFSRIAAVRLVAEVPAPVRVRHGKAAVAMTSRCQPWSGRVCFQIWNPAPVQICENPSQWNARTDTKRATRPPYAPDRV